MGINLNELIERLAVVIIFANIWMSFVYYLALPFIVYFCPYSVAIIIPYVLWMLFEICVGFSIDRKLKWWRKMRLWKYLGNYFPTKLIKTAELPEGKSYILAAHHHGYISLSTVINFGTEANDARKLFPGIDFRLVTRLVVYVPILREFCLSLGMLDASESSITRLLRRNISTGIVLLPGGTREVPLSEPGSNKFRIYASKRRGFVRIALKTGAALVPVVIFGDTELIEKIGNCSTNLLNCIPTIKTSFPDGFYMTKFMPNRVSLNTIVGGPITLPKVENPSSELIDKYHAQFYDAFSQLFEKYKHDYSPVGSSYELIIT